MTMSRIQRFASRRAWLVAVLGSVGILSGRLEAAQTSLSAEVRQVLQDNAEALSPLRVAWEWRQRALVPVKELRDRFRAPEESYVTFRIRLLWQDRLYRVFLTQAKMDWNGEEEVFNVTEFSCDGSTVYAGSGMRKDRPDPEGVPVLIKQPLERWKAENGEQYLYPLDYLQEAGLWVPRRSKELMQPAQSWLVHLIDEGAAVSAVQRTSFGQEACLAVDLQTSERQYRFYLVPALRYAVRGREERTPAGALILRSESSDFVQFSAPDIWLPRRCRIEHYGWPTMPGRLSEKPIAAVEIATTELSKARLPREAFALVYTDPGTCISDYSLPGADQAPEGNITYRLPANPRDLDKAIALAQQRSLGGTRGNPRGSSWPLNRTILIVGNVVLLGALVLLLLRRRICAANS